MNKRTIHLSEPDRCTGCEACADVCPTGSIEMNDGGRLFSYPRLNAETCISCGRCMSACPSINSLAPQDFKQQYFAAWNKNAEERKASTSGGAGTSIARYALSKGFTVYGVGFDSQWDVKHLSAENETELEAFRGSKYVQSDTSGVFLSVLDRLKSGGKVLFIGTPCQVEAIKRFTPGAFAPQLVTCEIICHGVNSPKVWKDYVNYLQNRHNSALKTYNFRSKSHGWQNTRGGGSLRVAYTFADGTSIDVPSWKNQYHYWFGLHYMLRPSCLHCQYRREQRRADITMADFWGVQEVLSGADTYLGVSAIIVSSDKGGEFVKSIDDLTLIPVDAAKAKSVLKGFMEKEVEEAQQAEIARAKQFEREYISSGFDEMVKKYPHKTLLQMFIYKVKGKLGLR